MCFVNHASSKCDCWKVIECSDWDVWKLMLGRLWRMTVYLPLDWCIFTEILNTKGRFWTSLRNSCLSVITIVLDSMLYETLKWSQIAPFCISSKKKFRRGADPDPLPFKIMAYTLLSLSYAPDVNFEPTTPFLSDQKNLTLSLNFVG
jgi:hypothetical protein